MADGRILVACRHGWLVLKLIGQIRFTMGGESRPTAALDRFLEEHLEKLDYEHVVVDLSETETIDSTNLGLLAKLAVQARAKGRERPLLIANGGDLRRLLDSVGFDSVFEVVDTRDPRDRDLNEIPPIDETRNDRSVILEAHEILASLSPENADAFKDVIRLMQRDQQP